MRIYVYMILSLFIAAPALAEESQIPLPVEKKQEIMKLALDRMWGYAKDRHGNFLQPADETQRTTIPISDKMADEVFHVGIINGIAYHCDVAAWEPLYLLYMQRIRRLTQDDVVIAYVSMLHGVMQGILSNPPNGKACDDQTRQRIIGVVEENTVQLEQLLEMKRPAL